MGEHVGIAVPVTVIQSIEIGIVPSARPKKDRALPDILGHDCTCQAPPAGVEDFDDVTCLDTTRCGVGGVDQDRFAPLDLGGNAGGAVVELAVKTGARLTGQKR